MIFACVAGPVGSSTHLLASAAWTWIHLLQCNISNQSRSITEDAGNKSWRPLPSGRITPYQAHLLHAIVTVLCISSSALYGWQMALGSIALTITTILYDYFRMSAQWTTRVPLVVTMYGVFEYGATKIISGGLSLDNIAGAAIISSLIVIATTAHVGDFPDVEGDKEDGRCTIPIVFPKSSRIITPMLIMFWSVFMVMEWDLGTSTAILFELISAVVACRNLLLRDKQSDKRTYVLHSLWLLTIHILPMNARWKLLSY